MLKRIEVVLGVCWLRCWVGGDSERGENWKRCCAEEWHCNREVCWVRCWVGGDRGESWKRCFVEECRCNRGMLDRVLAKAMRERVCWSRLWERVMTKCRELAKRSGGRYVLRINNAVLG